MTSQPGNQHTSTPENRPPDMAACESSEAPDTGPPGTGPGGPTPGNGHAADPPPPPAHEAQTAGPTGTAPSTAPAHRSNTGTTGEATSGESPTQGPPQAWAEPDARVTTPDTPQGTTNRGPSPGGHTRDEDSLDAFMDSCRSAPRNGPSAECPAQPTGATRRQYRGCTGASAGTPRGVPPGTPPARLRRPWGENRTHRCHGCRARDRKGGSGPDP